MASDFGAPFRAPCGGWPAASRNYVGGCWQNRRAAAVTVGKWDNATRVEDYRAPEDPEYSATGVSPYPRKADGLAWPVAEGCPTSPCDPDATGQPRCNEWPSAEANDPTYDCPAGDSYSIKGDDASGYWGNCYHNATPITTDLSQCRKTGFKNVQARKFWHGRFGFQSHDPNGRINRLMDGVVTGDPDVDCTSDIETEQTTNDDTKYRRIVYSVAYNYTLDWTIYSIHDHHAATYSRGMEVSDYGILSTYGCTTPTGVYGDGVARAAAVLVAHVGANSSYGAYLMGVELAIWGINSTGGEIWEISQTRTEPNIIAFTATAIPDGWETRVAAGEMTLNAETGEFHLWRKGATIPSAPPPLLREWVTVLTEDFTCSNTTWTHYRWLSTRQQASWDESGLEDHEVEEFTVTATLSQAYTQAGLQLDLMDLLSAWDMMDDSVYPWRQDSKVGIAPLVTINEPEGVVSPEIRVVAADEAHTVVYDISADCDYTDPNALIYDGSVRGEPLPAGYGPHFDWRHRTWKFCDDADGNHIPYIYAYGAWGHAIPTGDPAVFSTGDTTDLVVPLTATQWTENFYPLSGFSPGLLPGGTDAETGGLVAAELPGGGWVKFYGGCAMAQKWVEAKVLSKSYNYARPCGQDRIAMDETTVRCAYNYDADAFDVNTSTTIEVDDYVALCGVDGVLDGIYRVADVNGPHDHFTLDTEIGKIADYDIDRDCGSGIVGKVRFPDAPALCNRIELVSATQNEANVDIVLASAATYLRVGDSVDFEGVAGLGTNVPVLTRADAFHISVEGTLTTTPTTGGYISSHGAAAYYWNDSRMKGDFIAATWTWHGRDWRERDRVITRYNYDPQCGAAPSTTQIRERQQGFHRDISGFAFDDYCSGWDVCKPKILGCVPVDQETTTTWVYNIGFPTMLADERYGWFWQGAFYQTLPDWMWQEPYANCAFNVPVDPWVEDSGTCTQDYPQRPWVEARATLPVNGGPDADQTPPVGVFHRTYELSELNTAAALPDTILMPPAAPYYDLTSAYLPPADTVTPWGVYLAKETCVCEEGVFSAQYRRDGVQCPI